MYEILQKTVSVQLDVKCFDKLNSDVYWDILRENTIDEHISTSLTAALDRTVYTACRTKE